MFILHPQMFPFIGSQIKLFDSVHLPSTLAPYFTFFGILILNNETAIYLPTCVPMFLSVSSLYSIEFKIRENMDLSTLY